MEEKNSYIVQMTVDAYSNKYRGLITVAEFICEKFEAESDEDALETFQRDYFDEYHSIHSDYISNQIYLRREDGQLLKIWDKGLKRYEKYDLFNYCNFEN